MHAAKLRASPTQLCSGLPQIFADILLYARQLEFAERPDYQRLRTLLERNLDINDDTHQDDAAYGTEHLSADCSLRSTWPEGAPSEGLQAFRPEVRPNAHSSPLQRLTNLLVRVATRSYLILATSQAVCPVTSPTRRRHPRGASPPSFRSFVSRLLSPVFDTAAKEPNLIQGAALVRYLRSRHTASATQSTQLAAG